MTKDLDHPVQDLITKAAQVADPGQAVQFSVAALNVANALRILDERVIRDKYFPGVAGKIQD